MIGSPLKLFLVRLLMVFGFAQAGCLVWGSAYWFVDYAKMHGTSFPLLETVALIVTVIGAYPMLILGALFGIIAALWIDRREAPND